MAPAIVPSALGASATRRGGREKAMKTATAAARAAVARNNFFTAEERCASDSGCRAQCRCLVAALPGELGLGAPEMTEGGGLLVDRPAQVELFHDPARGQLEVL